MKLTRKQIIRNLERSIIYVSLPLHEKLLLIEEVEDFQIDEKLLNKNSQIIVH